MKPQHERPLQLGRVTLRAGASYRVIRAFEDHDGQLHRIGEAWTFLGHDFLPHDDGYTLHVSSDTGARGVIRMQYQPQAQEPILAAFEQYIEPVPTAGSR